MKGRRIVHARAARMSGARRALNRPMLEPPRELRTARDCAVVDTFAIGGKPGADISHYSLTFQPLDGRPFFVVTENAYLYQRCMAAEGLEARRFDVTYRPVQRPDGVWINQLAVLEEWRAGEGAEP